MAKWKCEICGNKFDNFHAQRFDNKIYCPLCYFKKENKELKKLNEEKTKIGVANHKYASQCEDKVIIMEAQQKEFIEYLEDKIDICDSFLDTIKSDLQETPYGVISTNKDITTRIKENETAHKVYEEILQKYKSIIGVSDGKTN